MAVVFDAASDGNAATATSGTSLSTSWTHTASGSDRCVIVGAICARTSGSGTPALAATYGGVPMTLAQGVPTAATTIALFYLLNPPTGSQTVQVTGSGYSGVNRVRVSGGSASYTGVGGVTAAGSGVTDGVTRSANTVTTSVAVPAGSGAVFLHYKGTYLTFSSYDQTQRATLGREDNGAVIPFRWLLGDAAGSGSTITSTATQTPQANWFAAAVRLDEAVAQTDSSAFFLFF